MSRGFDHQRRLLSLAALLCAISAFPQSGAVSVDHANQPGQETIRLVRERQILAVPTFTPFEYVADHAATPTPWAGWFSAAERLPQPDASLEESPATLGNMPGEDSKNPALFERLQPSKPADFNRPCVFLPVRSRMTCLVSFLKSGKPFSNERGLLFHQGA